MYDLAVYINIVFISIECSRIYIFLSLNSIAIANYKMTMYLRLMPFRVTAFGSL